MLLCRHFLVINFQFFLFFFEEFRNFQSLSILFSIFILMANSTTSCINLASHYSLLQASQTMQQQIRDYSKRYQQQQHPHKPAPTHNDATSESESDSDLDVVGHRGESQFWRRKIRTFHGILDVNNDGVISFDDFALLADRFVNLGHLSETHTQEFRALLQVHLLVVIFCWLY